MSTRTESELSEHVLDEVWMIMHLVAELGAHPEAKKYSEKKWFLEYEAEMDIEDIDDAIEADSPTERDAKEKDLIGAAEKLGKVGDTYNEEQEKLVKEIVDYIRATGDKIKDIPMMSSIRPKDLIFESGILSVMYSYFRLRLINFLGDGEDLSKIAVVSRVTKGVAGGLKDSSSDGVHLITCLSSKFICDKYGHFLRQNGGMAKLVLDSEVD